jgi:hypothetical protein
MLFFATSDSRFIALPKRFLSAWGRSAALLPRDDPLRQATVHAAVTDQRDYDQSPFAIQLSISLLLDCFLLCHTLVILIAMLQ